MASPVKPSKPEVQGVSSRRSTRLSISIPITINGQDAEGHAFKENARTIIINKHGAKITSFHRLALGAEVSVENRALGRAARACVVWVGDKRSPKDPLELGIQLTEAQNIWGIQFPPDDWQEGPPIGTGGQKLEIPLAAMPAQVAEAPSGPNDQAAATELAPTPILAATEPFIIPASKPTEAPRPANATATILPVLDTSPEQMNAAAEAALARFTQTAGETAEIELKSYEEKLAKLTNQFGFQTHAALQEAASRLEGKMVSSLEQQASTLTDRLQAARGEVEALLAKLRELQQSNPSETEQRPLNIQEAGEQAAQSALQELKEIARAELETASSNFVEATQKRVQAEAAAMLEATSKAEAREYSKKLAELSGSALEEFQQKAAALLHDVYPDQLRKILDTFPEKNFQGVHERLQQTADDLLDASAKQLEKHSEDTLLMLSEELREEGERVSDEVAKQIRAVTQGSLEFLTREMQTIPEEYHAQLRKTFQEFRDQNAQELEPFFQRALEEQRETILGQIQKEAEASMERALAEITRRTDHLVRETFDSVNKQVGAAAVVFRDWEELAKGRLENSWQKIEATAKTSARAFQNQMEELPPAILERVRKESDALVSDLHERLHQAFPVFLDKSMEALHMKLHTLSEELVEASAAQLRKQVEENLELAAEQLTEKQQQAVNESENLFRNAIAEMLKTLIQPVPKKTAEQRPPASEQPKKRR